MRAKLQLTWQRIEKPLEIAIIIISLVILIALIIVVIIGYLMKWGWTGLSQKTLWDWLQLLIVPLVLAVAALLFNRATTRTEQNIAAERYKQDQKIALDKQREDLLQTYLDRMSELLLKDKLRSSAVDAEVRDVARARTISILFRLDESRIGYVFEFLREADLMSNSNEPNKSIINLRQADLREINLSRVNLVKANFCGANLSKANFRGANLFKANLSEAILSKANLSGAYFIEADLRKADLRKADLSGAQLNGADLSEADLSGALLSGTNLQGARYNTKTILEMDVLRTPSTLEPTQWPEGFDPLKAGAICVE